MNVCHVSENALSGAPYRLAQVQRRAGLAAWLLHDPDPNLHGGSGGYSYDVAMTEDRDRLAARLAAADMVHYHNTWREGRLFRLHPWAWDVLSKKPSVIQFHSPRKGNGFEPALAEASLVKLVVAQYQPRLYPECRPVLNAVPIDDPLHRPRWIENEPPIVAFTPQGCGRSGWHAKGCRPTLAVLCRGFRHRFVTGEPWRTAMTTRQDCDIAIDEVVTGGYHMCSLEALAQGLATIAGLDEKTVDVLEEVTGTRRHPWIVATVDDLEEKLTALIADRDALAARRREGRRYIERHWQPVVFTRRFESFYAEARELRALS